MGLVIFTFAAIFVLVGSAGLLAFYRANTSARLASAIAPEQGGWLDRLRLDQAASAFKAVVQPFDRVLPKSPQEVSVARQRLIYAGLRQDSHMQLFYGAKVLLPLALCSLVFLTDAGRFLSPFFAYTLAAALGYLAPDFWLGRRIKNRRLNIRLGLPDFLDVMVVCVEAGSSIDQALARTIEESAVEQRELNDEINILLLEQRAGRPRAEAWKDFAARVNIDIVNALVSSLIQAEQFGTSISKTLRSYSDSLRVQRRQQVEEMAAKTPVKLVFPLVLFIFPSLYIVALGPAIITIAESFGKYFGHH